ncbi:drug/metabolite exporter YedA [Scleromatobacter humisilvae]|uniref:Drug/metabolite exporter YedA n=1 Tax=Scleromatobacter humisilvae TaxID=2897159 RepID=A0A9X1YJA6_9BURK|nr:drug/metabolite exporter YedA [Scleromatobacter humisilvae]MCK9685813.1 drug/metabolite exporter YedA [Scleromatobacter humisilvae]
MPNTSRSPLLVLCLAIVYVVWGSTYLAIHFVVDGIPPLISSAIRNFCAGPILLAFLKLRGAPWPTWRQWRNGALIGFMMMGLGNGFVCVAETRVPSGLAALIIAGTPVFAVLFAWGLFGVRPRLLEWLGIGLGLAGMGLLNLDLHAAASPAYVAVLFIAGASWAGATVLQPRLDLPKGPMSAAVQMVGGGTSLVAMAALHGERLDVATVPLSAWLALAYLVVFGSLVAYTAFVYVIGHSRPALATSYAYVNPVVAVGLGVLFVGETVSTPMIAGMAVILSGVGLVMIGSRRRAA